MEENARLRAVLGRCPKSVAVLDEQGRIRGYNREFSAIFDRRPNLGALAESLIEPEDRERLVEVVRRGAVDERAVAPAKVTVRASDGSERHLELAARSLAVGPERASWTVLTAEDRTAIVEEERARVSFEEEMDLANRIRAFGLAQATLCHDLGNAVTSALLALQALQAMSRHGTLEANSASELVTRGLDATHHAAALVTKVRDAERRRFEPAAGTADVAMCVERVLRFSSSSFSRRTVTVAADVERHLEVDLAASELAQVLTHLLRSAIGDVEGSGRPGSVRIWTERDVVRAGYARVHVEDDGAGIAPPTLTARDASRGTRSELGYGIGYAVARRIVERAGGRLEATRVPDRGTDVLLELPLAPP